MMSCLAFDTVERWKAEAILGYKNIVKSNTKWDRNIKECGLFVLLALYGLIRSYA